ncbi:MAG: carboxypeptidase regulatory-like domain-containing protein [Blastocatellales bacterium]
MKTTAKSLMVCLLLVTMLTALMSTAFGQTYTATVTGTVTDPQGAAVPGARVVAVNQGTKLEYTAQTSDSGVYTIPFLPVGAYVINVEASGFKKIVSNEIKLEVNQIARVNLQLQVGGVSDTVNVTDVAPVLQTESVTVGNVITGQTATNLPLNGRNFQQLVLLVPGAVTPNPGAFTGAGQGAQGRPYVNGNREQGNAFLLDGVSVDETIDNRIGYKPNVDSLAEFRVETSNSSSEFGNVTGATVNATLKSGTNELHGNVFEFLRNDKFDANSWANNRASAPDATGRIVGAPKQKLRRNVFGGTIGGPIIKERLFFFGDYQGTEERTGGGTLRTVPLAAWRTGNLSDIATPIRDPQGGTFTGNIIPANRIVNPAAKALFADTKLYPLPNRPGIANNYITDFANFVSGYQFAIKIDARLTERDNLSARYYFGDYEQGTTKTALPSDISGTSFSRPQGIVLNWTRNIGSTIVNEARVGMSRATFIGDVQDPNNIGNGNSKLGIPGSQAVPGFSNFRITGTGGFGTTAVTELNATNTFHYGDNLTIVKGNQVFKMGGQLQRYQQNRFYPGNNGLLGFFSYTGQFTGNGFADFLLDQLSQKGVGNTGGSNPGTWGHRQNRIGVFFQDDYKVRSNFTLNLGMRWEYTSPVIEVNDRQSNFDIRTGRQLFAGKDGNSRALYNPFYKGFEPRIGFAWTPEYFKNKLVVRAGYGITQYMEGTGANLRLPLNPPFFAEADVSFDQTSGAGSVTKGFTDVIVRNQVAGIIRIWNPDLRPQFTQQWNLTLEYQLNNSSSFSAAYVGNKATHLVTPADFNQALPDPGPVSTWRPLQQRRPLYATQPLVTAIGGTDSYGNSNYNGLQMSYRQRYAKGLEFLASYTYSKTLTDNIGYYGSGGGVAGLVFYQGNYYNRAADYGRAFFDARNVFSWAGTYELPIGKGRSFGGDLHPVANAILGGWKVNSILSLRSGFPLTIRANDNSQQAPRGGGRPNVVAGTDPYNSDGLKRALSPLAADGGYFNRDAFTLPAAGTFGNSGIGVVTATGYANMDFGIGKQFYITERYHLDFRADFYNLTNHPNFAPPNVNWSDTANFGKITGTIGGGTAAGARNLEFSLKLFF